MELVYQGTGGIVSNVVDMWKFHNALLGDKLLNYSSKKLMFDKEDGIYACGWYINSATDGSAKQHHSGKVRGFSGDFRRFPDSDSCIVVLANSDSAPATTVANVIEGILLPPKVPGKFLGKAEEKKIAGEYKDAKGRMLIVIPGEAEMPTQYMIYWEPKNPAAPISRGSVLLRKNGDVVMYQPGESNVIELKYSADKSQVDSIKDRKLNMLFERFDIEAWSKSQR